LEHGIAPEHLELLNGALVALAEDLLPAPEATVEAAVEAAVEAPPAAEPEPVVAHVQNLAVMDRLSAKSPERTIPQTKARPFDPTPKLAIPRIPLPDMPVQAASLTLPPLPPVYATSRRTGGTPTWLITAVVAVAVTLFLASIVQQLTPSEPVAKAAAPTVASHVSAASHKRPAAAATQTAPPETAASESPADAATAPESAPSATQIVPPPPNEYPYARFVEVTSLRVVEQDNRPQVQYLVVNNGEMELDDIALRIAVRSTTSPKGAEPLFTVAAWVPKLGPHQSKEIRTDLDSGLTASKIPAPATLRAEVRVTSQQ
jgi:hypothetical protein